VEEIEEMLRRRLGWNEVMMSDIMWRYIGINVDEYIAYGIDPNTWLDALYRLTAGNAYWFGLQEGDMYIRKVHQRIEIELGTTNPIDAILFAMLTKTIAIPSIYIAWIRNRITWLGVFYYLYLKYWPWYNMDYRAISGFDKDNLLKFIAGLFDSDGIIASAKENKSYYRLDVRIAACRQCEDFLTFIKDEIHEKLGIIGKVKVQRTDSILQFRGTHAVELVRYMLPHIRHPMKRLRAVLYLMYYDKELTVKDYQYLYEPLKYDDGINDPKRYRAAYVLAQAAPQTHTHGEASPVKSPRLTIKNRVPARRITKLLSAYDNLTSGP